MVTREHIAPEHRFHLPRILGPLPSLHGHGVLPKRLAASTAAGAEDSRLPELRLMFVQLAGGVNHVHDRGIIHRDLKPENVLLSSNGSVKIADFGLACAESFRGGPAGTPAYMAPEVLNGASCTKSSDMWSLGVIL